MNTKQRTASKRIDLRDQIYEHCEGCTSCATSKCDGCFFSTVDMTQTNLGGHDQYHRAFKYLRVYGIAGFKRNKAFGNHLNIQLKGEQCVEGNSMVSHVL